MPTESIAVSDTAPREGFSSDEKQTVLLGMQVGPVVGSVFALLIIIDMRFIPAGALTKGGMDSCRRVRC